jgi:Septum formation
LQVHIGYGNVRGDMGRWVCLRCYESNDAALVSCAKCGLARGTTPAAPEPGAADPGAPFGFPAAQPTQEPSMLGGLLRRFAWVPIVIVVALVGFWFSAGRDDSGAISRSGTMPIADVRVGDCFDLKDPNEEVIEEVDAKVCSEPHEYEMVFVGDMPSGAYPSEQAMDDFAYTSCLPAFGSYIGLAYERSRYELTYVTPTEDSWNEGDHAVQCAAYDPTNTELTASLRGANQ